MGGGEKATKRRHYLLAVVTTLTLPLLISYGKKAESVETGKATKSAVSMVAVETSSSTSTNIIGENREEQETTGYQTINQNTAWEMTKQDDGHIILDVRTKEEYNGGYTPSMALLPNKEINGTKPGILKDLDQPISTYCCNRHRAGLAAERLPKPGCWRVCNFGSVITWKEELAR